MQDGNECAFNPVKLVESLKLRTTEQQDAQECVGRPSLTLIGFAHIVTRFSKLFMAHLDTEFQKQADPTLKTLISSQVCGNIFLSVLGLMLVKFQGTQTYVTTCQKCGYRSERSSDFLEVEVTLTVGHPSRIVTGENASDP